MNTLATRLRATLTVAAFAALSLLALAPQAAQAQNHLDPFFYINEVGIQSAAGYSANLSSNEEFAVEADSATHTLDVSDADGVYAFSFAQNGDIITPDGYVLTTGGEVRTTKGRPVVQLDPFFSITRTPGGYELGYDKANGVRTVQTPDGQRFQIEDSPRHLCPSGIYYD